MDCVTLEVRKESVTVVLVVCAYVAFVKGLA